jgi:hypothetical protein
MNRRDFLHAGLAGGALTLGSLRVRGDRPVTLVRDPQDPIAATPPARWALAELERSLSRAGIPVRHGDDVAATEAGATCIVAAGAGSRVAAMALVAAGVSLPRAPESLALVGTAVAARPVLVACGRDTRALAYALLELADRVRHAAAPETALALDRPSAERPANAVRSVMRQFTSETLDTPWFHDRAMWPRYLDMLATQRFNRFHLAFGLGYDSLARVADAYLLFVYPFLMAVPGYDVRVAGLDDAERERNLATLRFVSAQAAARGLDFQLGIWTHGYQLGTGSTARHVVAGLTPETHAPYCRDALTAVLHACPEISAVALRIHGESGIQEGTYAFWRTIFDGVARAGRAVEIDLHAKGIDTPMIDAALATGMPVNVSPKYWAEHLGLPYHQAAIRELEMPVPGRTGRGLMTLSEGARVFTRYGYADLLRDDRRYTVRPRVFSGTQRILLSGDPLAAAAHARAFQFCGMTGVDLMEPLTCRGRRGTGTGTRLGYGERRLAPRSDWEKYSYWYRTWGRLTYNPDADPDVWRREFAEAPGGVHLEAALANASRILPLVTTVHLPSAACDAYWPEIYWNQAIVDEAPDTPYGDTPAPKTFHNASPLDPELFSRMSDCADALLRGAPSPKYSPLEVAQWIEDLAEQAARDLAHAPPGDAPPWLRMSTDVGLLVEIGRFFAEKFRAGVLYALHERTGDRGALQAALDAYRRARAHWAVLAERAGRVYQADLSASDKVSERGQWTDRVAGIDADIARMERRLRAATDADDPRVGLAVRAGLARPARTVGRCSHTPPPGFRPSSAVGISLAVETADAAASARLHYRHVNQAERFEVSEMARRGGVFEATIPAAYTDSPYPMQYYFSLDAGAGRTWLHPGLAPTLLTQPYFVLRRI